MKILILNYSDNYGGASISSIRLLSKLKKNNNFYVHFGVIEKKTTMSIFLLNDEINKIFINNIIYRFINKIFIKLISILKYKFYSSNTIQHSQNKKSRISIKDINNSEYDLLHLHWINRNMISIEEIGKINKPIVWTMHDSWVFCGAEHHPNMLENDYRYIEGYNRSNKPKSTSGPDICRKTWERKKKAWKNMKFYFISPSNFEKEEFYKSALFRNSKSICNVIPNIVPEEIFRPFEKKYLKKIYSIDNNKKIIGFGSAFDINNRKSIKGGYLLIKALQYITDTSKFHLVIFGDANASFLESIKISYFEAGFITNPYILAGIYNLCDVIVCPSLVENLPNVCLESLFCGIPVAAFNTGGIPDIVEHKNTGYLAKCYEPEDLYTGIMYCIDNYNELSMNSLEKAKRNFDNETIVKKHIELYETVLRE